MANPETNLIQQGKPKALNVQWVLRLNIISPKTNFQRWESVPDSKNLNNFVECRWNNWKKLKTSLAESLEPGFHKTGYFFSQPENMGEYSLKDNRLGTSKLRDKNLSV